jgi:hypothetical protein
LSVLFLNAWFGSVTRDGVWIGYWIYWHTCIHHSELHFTDHWHTQTSFLSLLQSPLAVSCQQLPPWEILHLPTLRSSCHSCPCSTLLNCQPSTNWVPGWQPFHTNLTVLSSLNWIADNSNQQLTRCFKLSCL